MNNVSRACNRRIHRPVPTPRPQTILVRTTGVHKQIRSRTLMNILTFTHAPAPEKVSTQELVASHAHAHSFSSPSPPQIQSRPSTSHVLVPLNASVVSLARLGRYNNSTTSRVHSVELQLIATQQQQQWRRST